MLFEIAIVAINGGSIPALKKIIHFGPARTIKSSLKEKTQESINTRYPLSIRMST